MTLLRTLLVVLFSYAIGQQSPPASASIKGLIRDAISGNPIESVTVEVRRSDGGANYFYSRLTSADGSFEFKNVSPGNYRLIARRADYLTREFGQNGWSGSGVPIYIEAGEAKTGIQLRLTRSGSIAGRITDKDGDPAVRNIVRAIAVSSRLGHRTYKLEQSATTNDLGEYRFWGLHPGLYVVSATATQIASTNRYIENYELRQALSRADPVGGSAPVYYPGTADSRAAAEIDVTPGASVRGGNFTVFPVQTRHVRGIVQGSGAQVQLIALTPPPGSSTTVRTANASSGTFDFSDVTPGEYRLIAQSVDKKASIKIDVQNSDISDLVLELKPGILIPTHVRIAGRESVAEDSAYRYIRFQLAPEPAIPGNPGPIYSTFPDGSVNFDLTPGENNRISLVAVAGAPAEFENLYIESIRAGTRDILRDGLQLDSEEIAKMEITLGTRAGTLTGTVVDSVKAASINAMVILIPSVDRRGRIDAYKTTKTDVSGRFQIAAIPPGEYHAFALEDFEEGEWQDSEFLRRHDGRGTPIRIGESETAFVALQSVP